MIEKKMIEMIEEEMSNILKVLKAEMPASELVDKEQEMLNQLEELEKVHAINCKYILTKDRLEIINLLIKSAPELKDIPNKAGKTPLNLANEIGNEELINLLTQPLEADNPVSNLPSDSKLEAQGEKEPFAKATTEESVINQAANIPIGN